MSKYIAINKCPKHGYYMISVEDDNGGFRLTGSKCCGSWKTVQRWKVDKSMIDGFNRETKGVV